MLWTRLVSGKDTFSDSAVSSALRRSFWCRLMRNPGWKLREYTIGAFALRTDPTGSEAGLETGTFTFTRTGDTTAPLNVFYTIGGNASHGTDYDVIFSPWTIPAGQASVTRTVIPHQDSQPESPETVTLTLTDMANYNLGLAGTETATVTITSDE